MKPQLEKRLKALEKGDEDPLILAWLFPPNGVPRSKVKISFVEGDPRQCEDYNRDFPVIHG